MGDRLGWPLAFDTRVFNDLALVEGAGRIELEVDCVSDGSGA